MDATGRCSAAGSIVAAARLGLLGFCYALWYEDDERHGQQRTIDSAIALLREAAAMAGDDSGPGVPGLQLDISDRLAAALLVRNQPRDIDEAIEILTRVRAQAAFEPMYTDAAEPPLWPGPGADDAHQKRQGREEGPLRLRRGLRDGHR